MDTTCPYGAVAMELSCFETWQAACISRVDVDMQCCFFLLAKDLAGIAGAGLPHGAFLSTSVKFQFWYINYSITAAEFLL